MDVTMRTITIASSRTLAALRTTIVSATRVVVCLVLPTTLASCALFDPEDKPDDSNHADDSDTSGASNDDDAYKPPDVDGDGRTKPPNPNTVVSANPTGCSGEGETFSAERKRCYRFVSQPALSWTNAAVDCSLWSAGRGHLVAVTSKEEDDFVRTFSGGSLWLGGSDAKTEGQWRWLSQEVWFFQNFEVGRPDNVDKVEHCLSKQESGLWDDLPCDVKLPYMCERAMQ